MFYFRPPTRATVRKVFENWHVAFHGTRASVLEDIMNTGELLKPGRYILYVFF